MRTVSRRQTTMYFDPAAEPAAVIAPGERVVVQTTDSLCGLVKQAAPAGFGIDDVVRRLGGACPVTGPLYVTGAEPGGVLSVHIERVTPVPRAGQGWTGVFQGFGALTHERYSIQQPVEPVTALVDYDGEAALLDLGSRVARIPLHPFVGTIGVAPPLERRMSFSQSPEYLGDVDLPGVTAGATLVLPVHVPGALLALGDAHAAQGDGEITGAAIEIEADVELSCEPAGAEQAGFAGLPQLNTAAAIAAAGRVHAARPGGEAAGWQHDRPLLLRAGVHRPRFPGLTTPHSGHQAGVTRRPAARCTGSAAARGSRRRSRTALHPGQCRRPQGGIGQAISHS